MPTILVFVHGENTIGQFISNNTDPPDNGCQLQSNYIKCSREGKNLPAVYKDHLDVPGKITNGLRNKRLTLTNDEKLTNGKPIRINGREWETLAHRLLWLAAPNDTEEVDKQNNTQRFHNIRHAEQTDRQKFWLVAPNRTEEINKQNNSQRVHRIRDLDETELEKFSVESKFGSNRAENVSLDARPLIRHKGNSKLLKSICKAKIYLNNRILCYKTIDMRDKALQNKLNIELNHLQYSSNPNDSSTTRATLGQKYIKSSLDISRLSLKSAVRGRRLRRLRTPSIEIKKLGPVNLVSRSEISRISAGYLQAEKIHHGYSKTDKSHFRPATDKLVTKLRHFSRNETANLYENQRPCDRRGRSLRGKQYLWDKGRKEDDGRGRLTARGDEVRGRAAARMVRRKRRSE